MAILALETSTKMFSLAVGTPGAILASRQMKLKKVLSSSIIPAIDQILKKARVPVERLSGLSIGLGPGSFTSLRVGLATVKALNCAVGIPVVGISSLDTAAFGVSVLSGRARHASVSAETSCEICPLFDARRNLVYAGHYLKTRAGIKRLQPYFLSSILEVWERIVAQAPLQRERRIIFLGDGLLVFREQLEIFSKRDRVQVEFASPKFWHPQAQHLIFLAAPELRKGRGRSAERLKPLYLYPDDCQVKGPAVPLKT